MPGLSDVSHDDIVELARKTTELVEVIYAHPRFNTAHPESSPKILWHTGDFARRTYTEYIAPNLPPAMDPGMPRAPPRSSEVVQGEAANKWPELNTEKYTDAQMRNLMSSMIILEPSDPTVQLMFPDADSGFDFGEEIREKARALKA